MSEGIHIPERARSVSNRNDSYTTEFVPQKVVGVKSNQKLIIHNQPEEHASQKPSKTQTGLTQPRPKKYFENPFHVVSELEEIHGVKTTGNKKSVLECIAKHNLKNQCPTQKEILKDLKVRKLSEENLKKIMQRLGKKGLVLTHPEKFGNEYHYVLVNLQDTIKLDRIVKTNGTVKEIGERAKEEIALENSVQNFFIQLLKNKPNPEFHNIVLKTQLSDKGDYYRICNWPLSCGENKAKIFEKRISRHRAFKIIIYPNGTTTVNIAASRQPYEWYCHKGWIEFIATCGEILNEIINELSITEPLKSKIYDWQVTQVDIGYDIPISGPYKKNDLPPKGSIILTRPFNNCLKVIHLDRVYQIYDKQLPIKGSCLRVEEQISFSSTSSSLSQSFNNNDNSKENIMTVHGLKKKFRPASVEEIIKTVFSIDIGSASIDTPASN